MTERQGKKSPRIRALSAVASILALLLLASAAAWHGINGKRAVSDDGGGPVVVTIPKGSSAASIAASLHRHGVLSRPFWFRALVTARGAERSLKAGTYRFQGRMSTADVLQTLLAGYRPADLQVTIPEGLTVRETIQRLSHAGLGSIAGFEQAILEQMPLVHAFDPHSEDAEGYLFPDTYRIAESWSEQQIIRVMLFHFLQTAVRTFGRTPGGAAGGLGLRQAVTLASLVEKETAVDEERALVAGVYVNRLQLGMRLQCDPTVLYALQHSGRDVKRLLLADLEYDSPWNTYRNAGLPPGPICCPGEAALRAACRPADTGYLYFVADGRGGHRFSSTIGEHNRAVARYRAWQRQQKN
jgi:UPF0755 protein